MAEEDMRVVEISLHRDAKKLNKDNLVQFWNQQQGIPAPISATRKELIVRLLDRNTERGDRYLVAFKGNKIVGSLEYAFYPSTKTIYAGWLRIDKNERRKGLATLLENNLYKTAEKLGVSIISHRGTTREGQKLLKSLGVISRPIPTNVNYTKIVPFPPVPPCKSFMSAASFMRLRGRMDTHKRKPHGKR